MKALDATLPRLGAQRAVAIWLMVCAAMVFAMVVLGGLTRLTDSGLSMVEWQVFTLLPPLSDSEWQREFLKYQAFPEYQKVNFGMSLAEFQGIFWLEYLHRLWGRLLGFAFALPFAWFLAKGVVDRPLARRLGLLLLLGAAQGGMGWFMVKSGLVDRPDVSHYRLAAHLALAVLIYGLLVWTALDVLRPSQGCLPGTTWRRYGALIGLAGLTLVSGAFVAGLHAGLIYNTFPLMDGEWVPTALLYNMSPWWMSAFEDIATIQFNHRIIAVTTVLAVLAARLSLIGRPIPALARHWADGATAMAVIQAGLGIATLVFGVPLAVAALHQAGALILITMLIGTCHALYRSPP